MKAANNINGVALLTWIAILIGDILFWYAIIQIVKLIWKL